MARYDDLDVPAIAFVGVISIVVTYVAIAGVQVLYYEYIKLEDHKKQTMIPVSAATLEIEQQEDKLNQVGWINKDSQVVAIPIESAKTLTLKQYQPTTETPKEETPQNES